MRPALARRLLLMTLLLVSLTLFATTLGAMRLPLVNLLPSGDDMLRHIWLTIRLPRVLLALLVGAALALSGCVMQGLFRNPLADPGLLGISSGAALAVASWLVLPFSAAGLIALYMPMLAAFIGSLAVMVVIFILSRAEEGSLSRLLLVAVAVAISGVIGFIGLVVPHLMRLWLGPDHRGLIPGSLLAGAILLLLADTLARTVAAPAEIPVGLLTSLLGAPWFLWLVFRRENSRHG
ncbi:FecCD family ABC transporter permease [Klebsiella pneumoniae]|uniref:FecCD family ABC transporter permease n=1 Tax=Klebsiella pneumoniae TaxID=573 RepID=UPI001FF455BE|nr:iron chelate uptake ABC transporter family permease subunit [Klebsiella pneumoniae]